LLTAVLLSLTSAGFAFDLPGLRQVPGVEGLPAVSLPRAEGYDAAAEKRLEALRAAPLDSPSFAARIGLDEDAPRSNDSSPAGLARRAIAGLLIRLVRGG